MLNKVMMIGNLVDDPRELRQTQSGQSVTDFRIAVNDGFGDNKRTLFVDVTVWGKTAENCAKYLRKGRGVFVEGRLEEDRWEDKESGAQRSKFKVSANNVQFMPERSDVSSGDNGGERERRRERRNERETYMARSGEPRRPRDYGLDDARGGGGTPF